MFLLLFGLFGKNSNSFSFLGILHNFGGVDVMNIFHDLNAFSSSIKTENLGEAWCFSECT